MHWYGMLTTGPFKNYPQITVYHPNTENGHDFANIGWTGWIGSITGTLQLLPLLLSVYRTVSSHMAHTYTLNSSCSREFTFAVGISSVKIAISEIGVSFPDETFGEESRFGIPFTVSATTYV